MVRLPKEKPEVEMEGEIEPKEMGYRTNLNNLVWKVSELRSTAFPIPKRGEAKLIPLNIVNYIYGVEQLVMLLKPYWDKKFVEDYNMTVTSGTSKVRLYLNVFGLVMELMERKKLLLERSEEEEW
jgi:hypothetical protein